MTDDTRIYAPDLGRLTEAADDSFSVRRAYGEPYQHEGQLIVPVAKVWGGIGQGAGGGAGTGAGNGSAGGQGRGSGKGALPEWKRSFQVSAGSDSSGDQQPAGGTTGGDATGDAEGEARGEAHGEGSGEGGGGGGGYGVRVKPLGVLVVSADGTRWQPVLDLNRVILGGQVVGVAVALALGWALGRRRRC